MALYFAYGSNMNPERLHEREIPFRSRVLGVLRGYRLVFNKRSKRNPDDVFANIMRDPSAVVCGAVYDLDEDVLAQLDRFEGAPEHYTRGILPVIAHENRLEAHVYVAQAAWIVPEGLPTADYMKHLRAGRDLLPDFYRAALDSWPTKP